MAASAEVLTAQLVDVIARLKFAEAMIEGFEAAGDIAADRSIDERPGRDRNKWDDDTKNLVERKFFSPDELTAKFVFKEWGEDFLVFVDSRDTEPADNLRKAQDQTTPILSLGVNPDMIERGKNLYRVLKKIVLHPEARALVVHVPDKNVWEAWRQIHGRFDPRNDAQANNVVQKLMDFREWKVKSITHVPVMIAKWEGLARDHYSRTGEEVLSEASRRHILLHTIPAAMQEHIRIQTLLLKREDLTYAKLRAFILDYAQQVESVATSMDMSALEAAAKVANDAATAAAQEIDSFGKYPKGGGGQQR